VGANVIRILPYSQHLRTVCLRLELHGCAYDGKSNWSFWGARAAAIRARAPRAST